MADPDDHLTRFGVTLPTSMIDQLDDILISRGYTSRSKGIRDAIRIFCNNHQWFTDGTGERIGVITIIYDRRKEDLLASIYEIRYQHRDAIRISLRKYISRDRRLDLFFVQGNSLYLKELVDRLVSLSGIETVKITAIPVNDRIKPEGKPAK